MAIETCLVCGFEVDLLRYERDAHLLCSIEKCSQVDSFEWSGVRTKAEHSSMGGYFATKAVYFKLVKMQEQILGVEGIVGTAMHFNGLVDAGRS